MTGHGTPVLTEQATDRDGKAYTQEWYCQPPAPGVTYMVTVAAWAPDYSVRRIFAISAGHGHETRTE